MPLNWPDACTLWGWGRAAEVAALRAIKADLHIHTCLSPCGGYDVSPAAVVGQAAELGLGMIAVCDHNSVENLAATREAAGRLDPAQAPWVLAGMEVTTVEEAHLVVLFDSLTDALTLQGMVYDHLQPGKNRPEVFGDQVVVNADDEVEGFNQRMLIGATDLGAADLTGRVHSLGGLVIAAHIDRPSFSLPSQLGIIPPELELDAVEISSRCRPEQADSWLMGRDLPVVTSSDAHRLQDVGAVWTDLYLP